MSVYPKRISIIGIVAILLGHGAVARAELFGYTDITGWTVDGRFLVYEQGIEYAPLLRRDRNPVTKYVLAGRGGAPLVLNATDYAKWVQVHPMTDGPWTARQAPLPDLPNGMPNKEPSIEAVVDGSQGKWNHLDGYFVAWEIENWNGKPIRCGLKREKTIIDSHTFTPPKEIPRVPIRLAWSHDAKLSISFVWSEDGKRIAWFMDGYIELPGHREDDPKMKHVSEVFIDRTWGPRIQIASRGLTPETIDKAATAIEKAGFAPTSEKEEPRQRSKSVVYAKKAFQEDAKKIATVIPGGATVEPLKQKGVFDVVVALGQSANTK